MAQPALTIDVGAKTDKYDRSMKSIGDTADRTVGDIEKKFESFDPQLNTDNYTRSLTSMVAGFGVAGVAVGALVGLVVNLNKNLAETADLADRVGLSTDKVQQIRFGANSLGIGDDDVNNSLDRFATNIQNAKFQANDLTRVFQANGIAIKDSNGQIKDTGTLLQSAFDIIKRAPTIQDAIQIGGFLGVSRDLAQGLKQSGDEFDDLMSKANAAGAVIDQNTIQKAREFDEEWRKAVAIWSNNIKAAANDILPTLNDMVTMLTDAIKLVSTLYNFGKSAAGFFKEFALPTDFNSENLTTINSQLTYYLSLRDKIAAGDKLNPTQLFDVTKFQQAPGQSIEQTLDSIIDRLNKAKAAAQSAGKEVTRVTIPTTPSVNPGPAKSGDSGRDQFETNVDQLTKRTAQINADTIAVTQNNAVRAQLRAEFQLLNAIMRDGGEVTQAQIDQYEKLRQSMGAQEALTAAGITLNQEHAASFLTVSQNVGTATKNYDQARDSLNKVNSASQQLGSALSSAFADAVVEGKNLNEVATNLIKTLEKAAINSLFASIFNAPAGGGLAPFASFLGLGRNASGTDNWRGGPTWVGENGPEILDLPKGSQVTPTSAARRMTASSTNIQYNVDASGADPAAISRLERVLNTHAKQIAAQSKSTLSSQRYQMTGVS